MKIYTFDNLNENSSELTDFKALLQYSLHLYHSADELLLAKDQDTTSDSAYIEAIFKKCHQLCLPLFHKSRPYNFFGSSPYSYEEINGIEHIYSDLNGDSDFWESAIKYQCIISALITLIHSNTNPIKISRYALCNKLKGQGYFSLLNEKTLLIKAKKLTYTSYQQTGESANYANTSANFVKSFNTFAEKLTPNEQNILEIKSDKSNISIFNSDLLYFLYQANMNEALCKKFNQFYTETEKSFCAENYYNASKMLKESLPAKNDTSDNVDKLLLQYKLERYYNLSLTNCIFDSITNLSNLEDIHIPLSLNSIPPEILSTTFNLPNVFSRNGFFKFALYSFNNVDLPGSTFYTRNNDAGPVSYRENSDNSTNNSILWLELYKKFTTFFSHIIFPVYERFFLIILKENLSYQQDKDFDFINNAISILHQYISENYDKIINYEAQKYKYQSAKTEQSKEAEWKFYDNYKSADKLFGNQETLNPMPEFSKKHDKNMFDTVLENILLHQNCIVHPNSSLPLTSEYFGFIPGEKFHRKLMNLVVESILNRY